MQRIKQYSKVSTSLTCLSNEKLKQILADSKPMHEGIGGKSALISIDDTPIFVKKVLLTDLEQLPQHFMSTANIFDLPLSYQYGVGSAGFGAWRELATHIMNARVKRVVLEFENSRPKSSSVVIWRRERDSNPRYAERIHTFQACAFSHSAISPIMYESISKLSKIINKKIIYINCRSYILCLI